MCVFGNFAPIGSCLYTYICSYGVCVCVCVKRYDNNATLNGNKISETYSVRYDIGINFRIDTLNSCYWKSKLTFVNFMSYAFGFEHHPITFLKYYMLCHTDVVPELLLCFCWNIRDSGSLSVTFWIPFAFCSLQIQPQCPCACVCVCIYAFVITS